MGPLFVCGSTCCYNGFTKIPKQEPILGVEVHRTSEVVLGIVKASLPRYRHAYVLLGGSW